MEPELDQLRFPVGKFVAPDLVTPVMRSEYIAVLEALPHRIREAVAGLTERQLDEPYRPGGWTSRQVVHHVPDSHLNGYLRFKLALTEKTPAITAYNEAAWAELPDARHTPIPVSLGLLDSLHSRWVRVIQAMSDEDFSREYLHPQYGKKFRLDTALALYSWHSRHHVAHITSLRERKGW